MKSPINAPVNVNRMANTKFASYTMYYTNLQFLVKLNYSYLFSQKHGKFTSQLESQC